MTTPLAERLRPTTLSEYIGQEHLIGPEGALTKALNQGVLPSIILWGPPGVGKTTLAQLLAENSKRNLYSLSAINAGVKDIRDILNKAKQAGSLFDNKNPILFIDEIHRFSKSQQDSLLQAVEKGWITLIGATTENPSFEVISALLSRCQVYTLKAFDKKALLEITARAIKVDALFQTKKIELKETNALLRFSGGDARKLLNILELVTQSQEGTNIVIDDNLVTNSVQQNPALYDKNGEQHYDLVSAFIKSIRGSDPNAALYWLARMLAGGEDIQFIARRLIILASEDIGNANPTALIMANNSAQAIAQVGMPESRIILSQCVIYLAGSPKSNTAYTAIAAAQKSVAETGNLAVPLHLRNAPTELMQELGYGTDYQYAHDHPNNFVRESFFPDELPPITFYQPGHNSREQQTRDFLKFRWKDQYDY